MPLGAVIGSPMHDFNVKPAGCSVYHSKETIGSKIKEETTDDYTIIKLEQDQILNNQSIGRWWWRLSNQEWDARSKLYVSTRSGTTRAKLIM